jgi:endonuclease/exonuclease/phosphatase family metal-dependent hydrolase
MRGFRCLTQEVPRGATWARMSDHLPLVVELELD